MRAQIAETENRKEIQAIKKTKRRFLEKIVKIDKSQQNTKTVLEGSIKQGELVALIIRSFCESIKRCKITIRVG